jgi:hypothetical protein
MNHEPRASVGPDRRQSAIDVATFVVAACGLYAIEAVLDRRGAFPFPAFARGAPTLMASLGIVFALQRRHGLRWRDLGLRRSRPWWKIPAWSLAVLIVTAIGQLTVVPLLAQLLGAPPPDLHRYDPIVGNLPVFLVSALGAMLTGGFIEEVIYRGLLMHRLERVIGPRRHAGAAAAVLSGCIFGLTHFEWGLGGMLATAVMGTTLGLLFLATRRNLWPLIVAHASLDLILLSQVYAGVFA